MTLKIKPLVSAVSMAVLLSACGSDDESPRFDSLSLSVVGRYVSDNEFDTSSAEIVSYDKTTDKLYVVNSQEQSVDVLSFDDQGAPEKQGAIDFSAAQTKAGITFGAANSVVANNGLVAIAIENDNKQSDGVIALITAAI